MAFNKYFLKCSPTHSHRLQSVMLISAYLFKRVMMENLPIFLFILPSPPCQVNTYSPIHSSFFTLSSEYLFSYSSFLLHPVKWIPLLLFSLPSPLCQVNTYSPFHPSFFTPCQVNTFSPIYPSFSTLSSEYLFTYSSFFLPPPIFTTFSPIHPSYWLPILIHYYSLLFTNIHLSSVVCMHQTIYLYSYIPLSSYTKYPLPFP